MTLIKKSKIQILFLIYFELKKKKKKEERKEGNNIKVAHMF